MLVSAYQTPFGVCWRVACARRLPMKTEDRLGLYRTPISRHSSDFRIHPNPRLSVNGSKGFEPHSSWAGFARRFAQNSISTCVGIEVLIFHKTEDCFDLNTAKIDSLSASLLLAGLGFDLRVPREPGQNSLTRETSFLLIASGVLLPLFSTRQRFRSLVVSVCGSDESDAPAPRM